MSENKYSEAESSYGCQS